MAIQPLPYTKVEKKKEIITDLITGFTYVLQYPVIAQPTYHS